MFAHIKSIFFENSTVRQTVFKNTFWLAVSNFGGRLLRAVVVIYAARVLGPSEWGVFNYAMTIVAFLTLFVDSGVSHIMIRDRAQAATEGEKRSVTSTAFYLKVVFAIVGAALILSVAPQLPTADAFMTEKASVLFPILVFVMIFDNIREFYHSILRSEERMEWEAVSFLSTNALIVGFGFAALFVHPTVRGFTFAYALGTGFGALITTAFARTYLRGIWKGFSWAAAKKLFHATWPYTVSGALGMLMINTDVVMLGWFRSSEEVGWYSAPQRIVQLIYLIPAVMSVSILPIFSRLASGPKEKIASAIEQTVSAAYMAALPITAGGIVLAPRIIEFLFGSAFTPGTLALQILLLTLLADFSAVLLSNAILAYNRQKNLVVYAALGGATNVLLNFMLIPHFGIAGCALATLGAQITSNAYLQRVVRRRAPFRVLPRLTNGILAAVIMTAAVIVLDITNTPVLLSIALGAAVYGCVLLIRREPFLRELFRILRTTNDPAA